MNYFSLSWCLYVNKSRLKHFLKIMRIFSFLFFVCTTLLFAENSYSQKARVTIKQRNAQLENVLNEIENQTDYLFLYNGTRIDASKMVSINVKEMPVNELLTNLFANTHVHYVMEGSHIILTASDGKNDNTVVRQSITITGTITDETGTSMPGVNIVIKGTTTGVISDTDGKYSIHVPNGDAVLAFSFIGYTTQEIAVKDQHTIDVQLQPGVELEEVVVTAMGITKEAKKLGYAVSTIKATELTKVGTSNFATALYGKASGVRITAPPGGSAAGVAINIRGLNSINGSNDPMVFLNGVPIRNGNSDDTYNQFAGVGLRSNGLVDINPEDIENITILKGASATALYGSEAANGVVMITSKKAKGTGVTVDVNATLQVNTMAYLPRIQTEYGPGNWTVGRDDYMLEHEGFTYLDYKGQRYTTPRYSTNHNWGPKYDGRQVLYWDGSVRPYVALTSDNPWKDMFRTGFTQIYNIAVNQGAANTSNRFSYTYTDETPNSLTGSYQKHNFNLTGNIKITDRITLDYSGNYIVQDIHNRQGSTTGAYDSFSNLFTSFTDLPLMSQIYQTSLGYRNYHASEVSLTPTESFITDIGPLNWLRDYYWGAYKNNNYETDSRFIGSVAPSWRIFDFLTLRGRVSSDLSADKIEVKTATERPLALYDPTGEYRAVNKNYSVVYGDIMLAFNKDLTDFINLSANIGWQGRKENMSLIHSRTDGGLTVENTFMLGVSRYNLFTEQNRMELLKTAFLGSIDLALGDYLFFGITGRQEKSSTLPHGSNSYFYPSANTSFIYTDAFRDALPSWYSYGKVRVSYGVVGNAPSAYAANIVYDQGSGGGASWSYLPGTLGNEKLKPEKINEIELGLENKFFNNRLGFEVSLYKRNISDMIIQQPVAASDGISNMWMNVGKMVNKGLEISVRGTPIETKNFGWEIFTNIAMYRNEVTELAPGIDYLRNGGNYGNTGGGVNTRSYVGRAFGDLHVNPIRTVEDPNSPYYGQAIVRVKDWENGKGGFYSTKTGEANQAYMGNIQPKLIGGLGTSLYYKDFSLDVMTDFRFGGKVLNSAMHYPTANGLSKYSMEHRDPEHGGLTYTYKGQTFTNGMIIPGVVEVTDTDGNVTGYEPNTTVTPSDVYYNVTYNWGNSTEGTTYCFSVKENSYWKLRELALGYNLPKSLIEKVALKNLRVSLFGRNLLYFYKTLDDIDAEATNNGGTRWDQQTGVGYSASPTRTFGISLRATF